MERKEEIMGAALFFARKNKNNPSPYLDFVEAAEWADRTMELRVRDYLETLTYQEYPGGPMTRLVSDDIINGLVKAMKE